MAADRSEKARCLKSDMHVSGESDSLIVPEKPANNGSVPVPAESVEGRGLTEENAEQSLLNELKETGVITAAAVTGTLFLLCVPQ